MTGYETATVRIRRWVEGRPATAGLGLLVGARQVVTCAHVINTALGHAQHEQPVPDAHDIVQVEFPLLPGAPVRDARVVAWQPPRGLDSSGDVAGLELLAEDAPAAVVPARFLTASPMPATWLRVFGYPGDPPRPDGAWVDVDVKGQVAGMGLQVDCRAGQTVRAQPGYSGSPVWDPTTGEAAGLLQAAPPDGRPQHDATMLPPQVVAAAWEELFDYLLVPENPYRGLDAFTTADAEVFFGRAGDIGALAARVRAQPVTVVAGPSGVGKSSLVQAGLIPELGKSWSVAVARPGQDPWLRLATAMLRSQHGPQTQLSREACEAEAARLRAEGLGPAAEFARSQDRQLLLVVDQFEEALPPGIVLDTALLDLLLPAAGAEADAARVVLTLRADYLPTLQIVPGMHTRLNDRLYLLSPLTAGQMREVVRRPAAARGVGFQPGLEDLILTDAVNCTLPVLEFTLTQLWEAQHGKTLTLAGYRAMGGVRGVLDQFAGQQAARLGSSSGELLDQMLLRLVRVPIGSPELTTRRRVRKSEIPEGGWQLLQRLAADRLVVQDTADGEPYAELAHETLITAWGRLRKLVTANAEFLAWLAWIQQRAADNDPLPEDRIAQARHWTAARSGDIPTDVTDFINASETVAEARLRELRRARDEAEAARQRADATARRAEALRLAADAELALQGSSSSMTVALALSAESVRTEPTLPGDIALRRVLAQHPATITRLQHENQVVAVTFSPDGTRLATVCEDGRARVFDAESGQELAQLNHLGATGAAAFSPDGTRLATTSDDEPARIFDAESGQELALLGPGRGETVWPVAFSPDGTRVATGSEAGWARVFDAESGRELARIHTSDESVLTVAFNPDGTRLATGSDGKLVRVFDVKSGHMLLQLDNGVGRVWAVAFSPDGTQLATGSVDGWARVFDAETWQELVRLDHGGESVEEVTFSPDGTRLATGSDHGPARVFDAKSGQMLARLDHDGPVRGITFSPDGTRVATGSADGSVRVFHPDPESGQMVRLDHHGDRVWALAFSPDEARVATGTMQGSARVFDASSGRELASLNHGRTVWAVGFSPDGTRLVTGSDDGWARMFDTGTWQEQARLGRDVGQVAVVAFSLDGSRLAIGTRLGQVWVFDADSGRELACLDHDEWVRAAGFSPDGTRLVTCSDDGWARVFDAETWQELVRLDHGGQPVWAVGFSPDGTRLVTGTIQGLATVVDTETWHELARIDHDEPVNTVGFSPDGTRLATGAGRLARVFDAGTRQELARMDHDAEVLEVRFSSDGTRLAVGSRDGGIRISAVTPHLLLQHAYRVMSRPLNEAELSRYSLPLRLPPHEPNRCAPHARSSSTRRN